MPGYQTWVCFPRHGIAATGLFEIDRREKGVYVKVIRKKIIYTQYAFNLSRENTYDQINCTNKKY